MATMDSRIILAGQPVNALASFDQGMTAAARQNEVQNTNALRAFLQQNGAGVMAGDQQALAGLAAFDPQAALGVQESLMNMDRTSQAMRLAESQEGRALAEHAATLSAAERQRAQAAIDAGIVQATQAYMAQDLAGVNAVLAQANIPPLSDLSQFPAIAARVKEARDMLDWQKDYSAAPEPADEYGRYVAEMQAAGQQPLSRIEYAQAKAARPTNRVVRDANGNVIYAEGDAAGGDLNELQSKNATFATRARGALETLHSEVNGQPLANTLTSRGERLLGVAPLGLTRGFQSSEYQVADAAGQEFLQAVLRKDTGAAITDQEQVLYGGLYLPQPGDTPEVLEYRRQARERAVAAIEAGMTPEAMRAQEVALAKSSGIPIFGDAQTMPGAAPPPPPGSTQGQRRTTAGGPQDAPAPGAIVIDGAEYRVEPVR